MEECFFLLAPFGRGECSEYVYCFVCFLCGFVYVLGVSVLCVEVEAKDFVVVLGRESCSPVWMCSCFLCSCGSGVQRVICVFEGLMCSLFVSVQQWILLR